MDKKPSLDELFALDKETKQTDSSTGLLALIFGKKRKSKNSSTTPNSPVKKDEDLFVQKQEEVEATSELDLDNLGKKSSETTDLNDLFVQPSKEKEDNPFALDTTKISPKQVEAKEAKLDENPGTATSQAKEKAEVKETAEAKEASTLATSEAELAEAATNEEVQVATQEQDQQEETSSQEQSQEQIPAQDQEHKQAPAQEQSQEQAHAQEQEANQVHSALEEEATDEQVIKELAKVAQQVKNPELLSEQTSAQDTEDQYSDDLLRNIVFDLKRGEDLEELFQLKETSAGSRLDIFAEEKAEATNAQEDFDFSEIDKSLAANANKKANNKVPSVYQADEDLEEKPGNPSIEVYQTQIVGDANRSFFVRIPTKNNEVAQQLTNFNRFEELNKALKLAKGPDFSQLQNDLIIGKEEHIHANLSSLTQAVLNTLKKTSRPVQNMLLNGISTRQQEILNSLAGTGLTLGELQLLNAHQETYGVKSVPQLTKRDKRSHDEKVVAMRIRNRYDGEYFHLIDDNLIPQPELPRLEFLRIILETEMLDDAYLEQLRELLAKENTPAELSIAPGLARVTFVQLEQSETPVVVSQQGEINAKATVHYFVPELLVSQEVSLEANQEESLEESLEEKAEEQNTLELALEQMPQVEVATATQAVEVEQPTVEEHTVEAEKPAVEEQTVEVEQPTVGEQTVEVEQAQELEPQVEVEQTAELEQATTEETPATTDVTNSTETVNQIVAQQFTIPTALPVIDLFSFDMPVTDEEFEAQAKALAQAEELAKAEKAKAEQESEKNTFTDFKGQDVSNLQMPSFNLKD
ncbi:hypothetical protein CKF54_00135 [Psittacicella hinzii]|uniref:Uncharacterized protein n=1 Tax=Psittacicella hinzii TaxID=2028575 RepID=A0A3A1YET8_9GAMM|nr:hypothetical protein [Psittacicella hinzii]RIY34567.1 hypothetical protein CKF54_00135 [Psittacicella hinzii]